MNYQKLDASLISALDQKGASTSAKFSVLVRIDRGDEHGELEPLGKILGSGYSAGHTVVTAYLTHDQIEALTQNPAVVSIRLAQQLRMMEVEE